MPDPSSPRSPASGPTTAADTPSVVTGNHEDKYAGGNPLIRALTRRFLADLDDVLAAVAAETSQPRVLEVGCGEGEIAERLYRRFGETVALDLPDAELRADWAGRQGPWFIHGDAHRLPFADDRFDVVVAVEVLEHLTDPRRGLAELARVTRGHLVASVPREPVFRLGNFCTGRHVAAWGNTPGHLNHWSKRGFSEFVGTVGHVVAVRTPFPWTLLWARDLHAPAAVRV